MASLKERDTYRQIIVKWTRETGYPQCAMEPPEQPSLPKGLALSEAGDEHVSLCSPQLQLALAAEDHVGSVGLRPLPCTVKLVKMAHVMFCVFHHKQWEWLKDLGRISPIVGCLLWGFIFILCVRGGLASRFVHVWYPWKSEEDIGSLETEL